MGVAREEVVEVEVDVQWTGLVWVVCLHFWAWAWARRGATEGARRSEWRAGVVLGSVMIVFGGSCSIVCFFLWFGLGLLGFGV